jgi:hypothetical protein
VGLVKALGGGWDIGQMNRETGGVEAPAPVAASAAAAGDAPGRTTAATGGATAKTAATGS